MPSMWPHQSKGRKEEGARFNQYRRGGFHKAGEGPAFGDSFPDFSSLRNRAQRSASPARGAGPAPEKLAERKPTPSAPLHRGASLHLRKIETADATSTAASAFVYLLLLVGLGRPHKAPEQGMGPVGSALQLGMELTCHKPGVLGQLHHLHQPSIGGQAGEYQPRLG